MPSDYLNEDYYEMMQVMAAQPDDERVKSGAALRAQGQSLLGDLNQE